MLGRAVFAKLLMVTVILAAWAYGWNETRAAGRGQPTDWQRFYYYPYIYYPHNFERSPESYDHLYYRYPPDRRIPVYNQNWYNFYPTERPYHSGHHFILDVF